MHHVARLIRCLLTLTGLLFLLLALAPRGRDVPPAAELDVAIPRILHASWKSRELPPKFKLWNDDAKATLADWRHILHTDEDNRRLVQTEFPDLLQLYDFFPFEITRADFARLLYMRLYGGVYRDLDVEIIAGPGELEEALAVEGSKSRSRTHCRSLSIKSLFQSGLRCKRELVLALHGPPEDLTRWPHSLPNAFMASVPGHPFWPFVVGKVRQKWVEKLNQVVQTLGRPINLTDPVFRQHLLASLEPEHITGPAILREALLDYVSIDPARAHGIVLLGPELVFGYNWQLNHELDDTCSAQRPPFNRTKCIEAVAVGSTTPVGKQFRWPKLLELRVERCLDGSTRVWPVELLESHPSVTGTLAISYWSHSWGEQLKPRVPEKTD